MLDLDFTGLSLICDFANIDTGLSNLNRELRFIARTLARLRHRQDAALVFSTSKQSPTSTYIESPLSPESQQSSPTMLKRLFFSPTKAKFDFDDIESAPTTPAEDDSPGTVERGVSAQRPSLGVYRRHTTAGSASTPRLELPLNLATPPRRRPVPGPRPVSWGGGDDPFLKTPSPSRRPASLPNANRPDRDTVPIIVDERSQAVFGIPRRHLSTQFASTHQIESVAIQPSHSSDSLQTYQTIYLPAVAVEYFSDFAHFTHNGRILPQRPKAGDAEWYIEHCARRLVAALALSKTLCSSEYESAAIEEFEALGPLLNWPEDYVNSIFAATKPASPPDTPRCLTPGAASTLQVPSTSKMDQDVHLARRKLVTMIAAKTHGSSKVRNVRLGPRRKPIEEGDDDGTRIRSGTFWTMYDAHCREINAQGQANAAETDVKSDDSGKAIGMGFVRMDSVRDRRR